MADWDANSGHLTSEFILLTIYNPPPFIHYDPFYFSGPGWMIAFSNNWSLILAVRVNYILTGVHYWCSHSSQRFSKLVSIIQALYHLYPTLDFEIIDHIFLRIFVFPALIIDLNTKYSETKHNVWLEEWMNERIQL